MLAPFPELERKSVSLGETKLELWGHKDINDRIHVMPDGSMLVLISSSEKGKTDELGIPWDEQVVLLQIRRLQSTQTFANKLLSE